MMSVKTKKTNYLQICKMMRFVKIPSCQDILSFKIGNIIVALYCAIKKRHSVCFRFLAKICSPKIDYMFYKENKWQFLHTILNKYYM